MIASINLPSRRSNSPTLKLSVGVLWNDDDNSFADILPLKMVFDYFFIIDLIFCLSDSYSNFSHFCSLDIVQYSK